jgi:hypothetical protein
VRDIPVDLTRYPEVVEAVRTATTVFVPDVTTHPSSSRARARWQQTGVTMDARAPQPSLSLHGRLPARSSRRMREPWSPRCVTC